MAALVERLGREGATRNEARRIAQVQDIRRGRGRPRNYVYQFKPKGGPFHLNLQFKRAEVSRAEVIEALEAVLRSLREDSGQ
jgi:Ser/Thr protein kinase RdoA (MazF antagonist)